MAGDEVTITVSRADLAEVLKAAGYYDSSRTRAADHRVRAAIPPPEWEPTEAQVSAYIEGQMNAYTGASRTPIDRGPAIVQLKSLRRAGLVLP